MSPTLDTKKGRFLTVFEKLQMDCQIIRLLQPELNNETFRFDKDGLIKGQAELTHQTPWIYTKKKLSDVLGRKCNILHLFAARTDAIHSVCHDCYKVVVKIPTVKELFNYHDWMKTTHLTGKCGLEKRPFTEHHYGGYFYCRGLDEAREVYKQVKTLPFKDIIIKRGCTEFEMKHGPSNQWAISIEQKRIERKLDARFNEVWEMPAQDPPNLEAYIMLQWIFHASKIKPIDQTYKDLTGGVSLTQEVKYVTYHE